jgi:hypothetical protein
VKKLKRLIVAVIMGGSSLAMAKEAAPAENNSVGESVALEEISATAVTTEKTTSAPKGENITATLVQSEGIDEEKPWKATVGVSTIIGSSTFVKNSFVRDDYVAQEFNFGAGYSFDWVGHKLNAGISWGTSVEYTTVNSNPARRWNPSDTSLSLSDGAVYTEPWTDISVTASLGATLPTSYNSINISKRWLGASASAGLTRTFGPVNVRYSLGFAKNFNGTKVPVRRESVVRSGDPIADASNSGFTELEGGFGLTNFSMSHNLAATYKIREVWSVGYSLGLFNSWKYRAGNVDEFTSVNADGDTRGTDTLGSSISLGYDFGTDMGDVMHLPFGLSMVAKIATAHPAKTADNKDILWPVFFNTWGSNRAANNYGTVSLGLVGSY